MDDFLDGPVDSDDVFPCKGCGEILEEGKAFELSGLRWHLDCFRCNTCNTLLDSDANLLLLGDGSLICNNCTYSCNACGNKIEDLAILTGDQAFCATCFRCRNCKRKIENLRYARTSQGIFCMSCHESLMARRRKKSKAAAQAKAREKDGSPMIRDKSLPALPPNEIPRNAFSNEKVSPDSDTPTELSPRPRAQYTLNDSSSRDNSRPARSPERTITVDMIKDPSLAPPPHNYRNNRNSSIMSGDVLGGDVESFFIPVALDPTPAPSVPSVPSRSPSGTPTDLSRKPREKDYFSVSKSNEARSGSQASTPHIAFQEKFEEKERTPSADQQESPQAERPTRKLSKRQNGLSRPLPLVSDDRKASASSAQSAAEDFRLQEAPKSKKLVSSRANSQSSSLADNSSANKNAITTQRNKDPAAASANSDPPASLSTQDKEAAQRTSTDSRARDRDEREVRPSLESTSSSTNTIPRKEVPSAASRSVDGKTKPAQPSDTDRSTTAPQHLPRPPPPEQKLSDTYMQPRVPPQVPVQAPKEPTGHSKSASDPTTPKLSPRLPRWSAGGDFSMDDELAQILGTDEGSTSLLRRVSNAVRHGRNNSTESSTMAMMPRIAHSRSVSETTRLTGSPRWPKTPITEETNGAHGREISSPISLSGAAQEDPAFLKRQLRNSEQRVVELERQFNAEKDLKNLNRKLTEKRKTVSVLDTQTEIMIRQLEVLAGYVERAKDTKQPIDARDLEDSAIKEFVQKLEKVKQTMSASIEELLAERDDLIEEKNQVMAERDRALLEFEQLSSKNAQLADLNNDLTHQIQERFKSQSQSGSELKSPNGLGIYSHHAKGASTASVNLDASSLQTAHTLVNTDEEPVLEGPTVVNIRKGQVRKFNWKKGGSKVASGITKGINRAAVAFQGPDQPQHRYPGLAGENIGLPYNMTVSQVDSPASHVSQGPNGQNRMPSEAPGKGFGFFGGGNKTKAPRTMNAINMAGSVPAIAEAPTTLFGSDLVERADYERRQIPSVVTRCIEEVELRGMDVEGIYRKTGGTSLVKMVQEGFDKQEDFDISDPSIDITAVTSVLKQYFRKLPNPLLTFDVYERILDSNAIENDEERCAHLRKTVNMLPPKHRDCLEFLMFHLARVAGRERENLMSPKNLAVVFAPTIMRDLSIEKEMTDMHVKNTAVQYIIEHSDTIFSNA